MSDLNQQIKSNHTESWKGIKEIIYSRGTLLKWPFWTSGLIALFTSIAIFIFIKDRSFSILQQTCDLIISVFPSLLGFSLGGYAIVIGFSNTDLIKRSTKKDKYSIYQILSAIFALNIIFQIATLIISFIIGWIVKINLSGIFNVHYLLPGIIVNCLILLILLFGALYSLALTPYVVFNLFTLGQINNLFYTIQKIQEDEQKK